MEGNSFAESVIVAVLVRRRGLVPLGAILLAGIRGTRLRGVWRRPRQSGLFIVATGNIPIVGVFVC